MKILNLYAGIGGNRMLWGDEHEITAVELDENIAAIYKDLFPKDNVIVGDAHDFLLTNFKEFDFIWSSPPCPSHSRLRLSHINDGGVMYPDMTLYQEIILLKNFAKCDWVVENVIPYYKPLVAPSFELDRHLFWSNKMVWMTVKNNAVKDVSRDNKYMLAKQKGFDLMKLENKGCDVRKILRNAVQPEIGNFIFEQLTKDN
jgi:DNA (cytosine-5)-methyltransferase 1